MNRVIIFAPNWLGDAVMSLPAIRAVRARFPETEIAVLARPWVADLYEGERSIDRVIRYEPRPGFRDYVAKWRVARALQREKFDCAILLHNAFEAAAIVWLAGIPRRIGYDRGIQGNLDPVRALAGWPVAHAGMREVLVSAGGRPGHIFNLGHGVLPETDPDVLKRLVDAVHAETAA